jgi:ATP-binding cassette subfamily A (ABC1) protein 3
MVIILAFSTLIFILRVVPDLELLGDNLHYAMRIFPSYSIATALYTDASLDFISQIRNSTPGDGPDISDDVWDLKNNLLDLIMMFAHLIFWFLILFLIEVDLGKRIRKCWQCCCRRLFPNKDPTLKLD